jgi:peptidoglycan/LPS O-acetylase OafA/YrhL
VSKSDIRALTGIRGVAAIAVAAYHFFPIDRAHDIVLANTLGRGYLCVDLFFILSGYVMALNYAKPFAERITTESFGDFLIRRLARIYPLYLAIIVARLVYTFALYPNFAQRADLLAVASTDLPRDLGANLLLVQSWGVAPSIVGQAWSISTEWGAYLLFPVLVQVALFARSRTAAAVAVAAATVVALAAFVDVHDGAFHSGMLDAYDGREVGPLLRCVGGFTLGLLVYRLSAWRPVRRLAAPGAIGVAAVALLFVALAAGLPDLVVYPLFPLLVLHLAVGQGPVARGLSTRLAVRLGELSYAIYLLHIYVIPLFRGMEARLAPVLPQVAAATASFTIAAAALLALSWAAYEFIEVPGRDLVRTFHVGARKPRHGVPL